MREIVVLSLFAELCLGGYPDTARSILYAIRNGARRCRTPLDTGECAHQGAPTHPFLTHFVSNEWLSLSATGRTRPSRPASTRCPPIADASSTRRCARDQASACRRSSFSPPNAAHPAILSLDPVPTAWSFLASTRSRRTHGRTTYYLRHNPLLHTRLSPPGLVAR